ncbi:Neuropilin and tolloid-like protein 2 [Eumeta japonica]|uniref:Neuropilin and tolloid-like protein 2 n=1 Tax=Eumeta variegata TaxID=151549 RepID=A0A4C1WH11_EUMVA|nr:Neuropilin and tolloid-like protein 2 [Eumeta japonica]
MLQLLSQEDIKELIPILGHRVKLIAGIKQLKQIIDKAFPTEEQEQNVLNIGDVISTSTNDISLSSILNTHEYCIILSDVPAKEPHISVRLYTVLLKRTAPQSSNCTSSDSDHESSTLDLCGSATANDRRHHCSDGVRDEKLKVFSEARSGWLNLTQVKKSSVNSLITNQDRISYPILSRETGKALVTRLWGCACPWVAVTVYYLMFARLSLDYATKKLLTKPDQNHISASRDPHDVIRDGMHGYSMLINRYCGNNFPPRIQSTGPYLWLKFHSDDTIEYEGFKISIKFEASAISRSIPASCYINKTGGDRYGVIGLKEIPDDCKNSSPLDVLWNITTPNNTKIHLNFTTYKLKFINDCTKNYIQIFEGKPDMDNKIAMYCGSVANPKTTKGSEKDNGNVLLVRLYLENEAKDNFDFNATYTAFRTLNTKYNELLRTSGRNSNNDMLRIIFFCTGTGVQNDSDKMSTEQCDPKTEFDCEDNTCIEAKLECDDYAHCRLKTDEHERCKAIEESMIQQPHILVILVIFSLILSGMSFVFLFKCIKKLVEDHKAIKKHLQESCEDRLDEILEKNLESARSSRSQQRASSERDNRANELFKRRHMSPHQDVIEAGVPRQPDDDDVNVIAISFKLTRILNYEPTSIDSDFIQETQLDEEIWRRDVESLPIDPEEVRIERNGRTRKKDISKKEESMRKDSRTAKESEEERERKEIRDVSVGAPDTKESGCQTRESLFQAGTAASSDVPSAGGTDSGSGARGFSTFGYSGATLARPSPAPPIESSQITIELLRGHQDSQSRKSDRRPISTETTRSAPDVIIVSKPIR